MKKLYIMCGLPGCGKSTLSKKLAECTNGLIVSYDGIRSILHSKYNYEQRLEGHVRDTGMFLFCSLLSTGRDIIIDETNLSFEKRMYLIQRAELSGYSSVIFYFPVDLNLSKQRRTDDNKGLEVDWDSVIDEMYKSFCPPTGKECRVITVDTQKGYETIEEWLSCR